MVRFTRGIVDDESDQDENEVIVKEEENDSSWQREWWKRGGDSLIKEDGEISELDDDDGDWSNYNNDDVQSTVSVRSLLSRAAGLKRTLTSVNETTHCEPDDFDEDHNLRSTDPASQGRKRVVRSLSLPINFGSRSPKRTLNDDPTKQQIHVYHKDEGTQLWMSHLPQPPTAPKSPWSVKRALLFMLVAVLLNRYSPPPPPSESNTSHQDRHDVHLSWAEYLFASGGNVVSNADGLSRTAWYFVVGFTGNFVSDIMAGAHHLVDRKPNSDCTLKVPMAESGGTSKTEELLLEGVVGQDRAIRLLSRALDAWGGVGDDVQNSSKPLVLLLAGSEGVGKMTASQLIAKILFQHCSREEESGNTVLSKNSPLSNSDIRFTFSYTHTQH